MELGYGERLAFGFELDGLAEDGIVEPVLGRFTNPDNSLIFAPTHRNTLTRDGRVRKPCGGDVRK